MTLVVVLSDLERERTLSHVDDTQKVTLVDLSNSCYEALHHLRNIKQRFDSLGPEVQSIWETERWRAAELAEIRAKLETFFLSFNAIRDSTMTRCLFDITPTARISRDDSSW